MAVPLYCVTILVGTGTTGTMAFIVFEGIDGSGKTTQIQLLQNRLVDSGKVVTLTREPGGTPLAEELRLILLRKAHETPTPRCELLLYEAARAQHVDSIIRPALEAKHWVLCDRFTASTVAFQEAGRGLERSSIDWLNYFATAGVEPDLTVLLDLTVQQSQQRRGDRNRHKGADDDRFESEKESFHERVRNSYLQQASLSPQKWLVIDGRQDASLVSATIWRQLGERGWLES